ncbi:MAG: sigma-E factor negative regulatory protein [Betaproteobacteria bacterium]
MEKISAFMDGEIAGVETTGQVNRLKEDADLRATWGTYHVIGDILRGEKIWLSPDFGSKLTARLADEPTVLAPQRRGPSQQDVRRYALPVAASVGGIALVAWLALFNNPFAPPQENLAVIAPAPVEAKTQVASGDVNDYLMAHQQVSSSTTLQGGVVSYVRTVSGDTEEKR